MLCVVLPVPYCFMLYALADTDARHYGNLIHLQISPETYLALLFSTATVQIKPNYTILPFLSNNKEGCWGWGRFNAIIEILLSLLGVARARCAVMDAACQNAYWWWSAKTQFAVIRQLPSNYVSAKAFLKPSNSNPSLFSEWLDHCPWQTGTKWAALCMLPLMFYWFA